MKREMQCDLRREMERGTRGQMPCGLMVLAVRLVPELRRMAQRPGTVRCLENGTGGRT